MKKDVVLRLNQLNTQFYTHTAESFDQTRQRPWQGWLELKPLFTQLLSSPNASCLDIGCGNARLAVYLTKEVKESDWHYVGLDSSKDLLNKAVPALANTHINSTFFEFDLVNALLGERTIPVDGTFNLIALFGVLHHIPGFELRVQLLKNLRSLANPDTSLIITTWQFTKDVNLVNRSVSPSQIGLNEADLEFNDYLLTWERDLHAVRFCHYTSDEEMSEILKKAGWGIEKKFTADGKTGDLNHYFVLKTK